MVRTMEHGHEIFIALQKISILENPVSGFRFPVFGGTGICWMISLVPTHFCGLPEVY